MRPSPPTAYEPEDAVSYAADLLEGLICVLEPGPTKGALEHARSRLLATGELDLDGAHPIYAAMLRAAHRAVLEYIAAYNEDATNQGEVR